MENKLGNESAYPLQYGAYGHHLGISKRFYAACAAMQGLLASDNELSGSGLINVAYEYADELLKQENE
jgi:hypothetical protein